jgi:spore coat polysaccharide biosynthesis protein SpsF (cytidylyltransferase family)
MTKAVDDQLRSFDFVDAEELATGRKPPIDGGCMSQAVIILQAHMASTRLPGGRSRRLARARSSVAPRGCALGAAPVVLATTTNQEDDVLRQRPRRCRDVHGPADTLTRYALAARSLTRSSLFAHRR